MSDGPKNTMTQVPVLNVSNDIMSYRGCPRRYMYYNVLEFPQTNNMLNWSSHFILDFVREAYNSWLGGQQDADDYEACYRICEKVRKSMLSNGVAAIPSLYSSVYPKSRNFLMNNRAFSVMKLMVESVFPAIVSIDESLSEYCDSDNPCSITGSCGIIDSVHLMSEPEGVLCRLLRLDDTVSRMMDSGEDFEVLFQLKGTDRPDDNSSSFINHGVQMGALLEMRNRMNRRVGKDCKAVAGFVFYLNEMWYSLDKIRGIIGRPDITDEQAKALKSGEQLPFDTRVSGCIRMEMYDPDSDSGCLKTLGNYAEGLVKALTNSGNYDPEDWAPGEYSDSRCSACDFRMTCPSVPEDEQRSPWKG